MILWKRIKEELFWPLWSLRMTGVGIFTVWSILRQFGYYTGAKLGFSYILGIMFYFCEICNKYPLAGTMCVPAIFSIMIGAGSFILWGIASVLQAIISCIRISMKRKVKI